MTKAYQSAKGEERDKKIKSGTKDLESALDTYGKNVAKNLGLVFGLHGTEEDLFELILENGDIGANKG